MAENIVELLTDVADAIREKKGSTEPINAQNFAEEIRSIEGGGGDSDTILSIKVGNSTTFSWQEITEAVVHEGITTIGANGFNYAYKVTSINLPNSLLSIMRSAFDNTSALKSLHIPINVSSIAVPIARNSKVETLSVDKDNVYYDSRNNCNAIIQTATNTLILGSKSTTIPDDIVAIAESAFQGGNVEKLIFPPSVTSIAASPFSLTYFFEHSLFSRFKLFENSKRTSLV